MYYIEKSVSVDRCAKLVNGILRVDFVTALDCVPSRQQKLAVLFIRPYPSGHDHVLVLYLVHRNGVNNCATQASNDD